MYKFILNTLLIIVLISTSFLAYPENLANPENQTHVVILGTGTPAPDYKRSGPSVAVIHKGQAYVFDAGGGMVQRALEAQQRLGIAELEPEKICCLFFTHLHSDHIHDYSELASTRWWNRKIKLKAWGPTGLKSITNSMQEMMAVEAGIRTRGTPKEVISNPEGYLVDVTEIREGVVFKKDDLTIEAFSVPHGKIKPAFGYKITTENKNIVISGDTGYSEKLIEKAGNVDILLHEVISAKELEKLPDFWQHYHGTSHTTTKLLAKVATKAQPKLLVLYHIIFFNASEEELLDEVRSGYEGEVVLPDDLDIF